MAKLPILFLLALIVPALSGAEKARLIVLTDISSLTSGVREPDDGQSMVRLMLFANEIHIEGLIASSNMGHGQVVRPELIREAITAYAKARPNLLKHSADYPDAERLLACIKSGQPVASPKTAVFESIGPGKDTEGSEWIIQVVGRSDPRPVWVAIWGGSADLAQALWKVSQTRSKAQVAAFLGKLRIHSIYDQDSTGAWIKSNFPELFYITRNHGIRGMYRGGDLSLVSADWVETHVRNGHGPLGELYPNYDGGDIWTRKLGRVRGVKEGDTPSFLALLPVGLGDILSGNWGGHVIKEPGTANHYIDVADEDSADSPDPRMSAVYKWRPAFQAEFQARLDWCVQPRSEANHQPQLKGGAALVRTARPGSTVRLDARGWSDPDGDRLVYQWSSKVQIKDHDSATATLVMPSESCDVLLTVRDNGTPSLHRYQRIRLEPKQ